VFFCAAAIGLRLSFLGSGGKFKRSA